MNNAWSARVANKIIISFFIYKIIIIIKLKYQEKEERIEKCSDLTKYTVELYSLYKSAKRF